jgi:hypothetical protein
MGDALQQETDLHRGVHMYANCCSTVSRPLGFGERRQYARLIPAAMVGASRWSTTSATLP